METKFEEGDWTCECGEHNFRRRGQCRKCDKMRENPLSKKSYKGFQSGTQYNIYTEHRPMKTGDWICPNKECGEINFARRTTCRKCDPINNEKMRSWLCITCNQININNKCTTCGQNK
jgi:predicted RNA-binding Zn-ribbon protein involved in translation (DUF1610 family)